MFKACDNQIFLFFLVFGFDSGLPKRDAILILFSNVSQSGAGPLFESA